MNHPPLTRKSQSTPGAVIAVLVILFTAALLALASAFVWFALDVIGGIEVSFREALAGGLLLIAARSSVSATS